MEKNYFECQTIAARQNRKERDYWMKRLSGDIEKSVFPFEKLNYDKITLNDPQEETLNLNFSSDLSHKLVKLSNSFDPNLNIILLAGVVLLLSKYASNKDIIVGTPVFKQEIEADFINTVLVIKNRLFGEMTFKEFLLQMRNTVIEAIEHQNYPIETLTYKLNVEDVDNNSPFFDVAVLLRNIHDRSYLHQIKTNMVFSFTRIETLIELEIEYNSGLYRRETVKKIANHLQNIFHISLSNSNMKLRNIDMLSGEEKKQLLTEFNDNKSDFPRDKTIYQLMEDQVRITPQRIALTFKGTGFTYRELNHWVNRLARVLKEYGSQKNTLVGIMLDRSPLMVISILAAWKTGAAYIPIDANTPFQRNIQILNDSSAQLVLTQNEQDYLNMGKGFKSKPVVLSNEIHKIRGKSKQNLGLDLSMNGLAYIIYTSGSTGSPKGAMVEHIGMMNHIQAKINTLQLSKGSIIAQNASHCFDISVWQFFTAFIMGGKTVIYSDELVLEPDQFLSHIKKDLVTILEVVPTYLSVILSILDLDYCELNCLKYLLVTGEALKYNLVKRWFQKYKGIKLVNAYGPTEASDDITHHIIETVPDGDKIPIGRSLQNLNIYIVDKSMNLCPPGVKGEIFVSGVGVGRGYLNDPEKTVKSFTHDSFRDNGEMKLYKTGDLGYFRPDGRIIFLGRKDHQVKIRGYRIELEEINKKLSNYDGIQDAVVIEKEEKGDGNDSKYLCAFFVANDKLEPLKLKEYLLEILPEYMIPKYFQQLDQMPLTSNGKIDRNVLKKIEISVTDEEFVASRNAVEERLVEIWADVLGLEKTNLSVTSNFFELGGHSLKIILVVSRIHKEMNVKIPLKELFILPTIRELSQYIIGLEKDKYVSIKPVEKKEFYLLSSTQKRLYFLQQMNPDNTNYNLPNVITLEKNYSIEKLEASFKQILIRHESLRTSFVIVDDQPVQKILNNVEFSIEKQIYPVKKGLSPSLEKKEIIRCFRNPFDLSKAPLIRVALTETLDGKLLLLFDMHHIITDGVSQELLKKEFVSISQGADLSALRLQYKDFSEWQMSKNYSKVKDKQKKFWMDLFSLKYTPLNLPTDFTRPKIQSFEGAFVAFTLNGEETAGLKNMAKENNVTLFMTLMAICNILLSKLSGQADIVIGTPVAERRHTDLEKIIGMFANTIIMRTFPDGEKTFKMFLQEVKQSTLEAYENQEYPFEELVENISKGRDISRNPLFDVMLNLQSQSEEKGDQFTINEIKQYEHIQRPTKFDMHLSITDYGKIIYFDFEYCTRLYKPETINRFIGYFKDIVTIVVQNTEILLKDITITHSLKIAKKRNKKVGFNI